MLSMAEAARHDRGRELRRYVRAAAAMREIYDEKAIGDAVGVSRNTVAAWWKGAQPSPETLTSLAAATGLSPDELIAFVYLDGPPPHLAEPGSPLDSGVGEGIRRDLERRQHAGREAQPPSPARPPRDRPGSLS